jgi:hypothetical protein
MGLFNRADFVYRSINIRSGRRSCQSPGAEEDEFFCPPGHVAADDQQS